MLAKAALAAGLLGIMIILSLYYSDHIFGGNVMSFVNLVKGFEMLATGNGEPFLLAGIALLLLMVAVYLLFKRESGWHTVSGTVIGLVAAFYLLVAGEGLYIGDLSAVDILAGALRLFGLV